MHRHAFNYPMRLKLQCDDRLDWSRHRRFNLRLLEALEEPLKLLSEVLLAYFVDRVDVALHDRFEQSQVGRLPRIEHLHPCESEKRLVREQRRLADCLRCVHVGVQRYRAAHLTEVSGETILHVLIDETFVRLYWRGLFRR